MTNFYALMFQTTQCFHEKLNSQFTLKHLKVTIEILIKKNRKSFFTCSEFIFALVLNYNGPPVATAAVLVEQKYQNINELQNNY